MRLTRRATVAGAGLGLAGLGMAGLGGTAQAQGATALKATWNGWPEGQVKPLFDAFNAAHPGINASYELIPFTDLIPTLEIRLGGRTPDPDIYACDSPLTASYAVRGHALALDEYLNRADYSKAAIDAATYRGRLYSAPFSTSSQLLFYNREYFRQAGVEPPPADPARRWTWEQVVEAGRRIADPAANRWGLIIEQADRPYQHLPFGQSLGGSALSEDGLRATGHLDGPAWVEAFTFVQRLYADWKIAPPGQFNNNVTPDLFGSGRSGMFLGGTFNLDTFKVKYPSLDWGVAPHPYFRSGKPVTPTGAWHIAVNPRTRHRAEVGRFIQFMQGPELQQQWFHVRPYVPTRRDMWARMPEVFATEAWQVVRHEVENTAIPRPATPGWREYEDLLRQTLRDIQGGGDVKAMLADVAGRIDRQLVKYRNA